MPKPMLWTLLALLLLVGGRASAAPSVTSAQDLPRAVVDRAAALRDEAVKGTQALAIVRSLTFEVGPRLAGSAADRAAVEWGLRTLKALGFDNVHAEPVTVPHWERGAISGEILAPWPQPVVLTALGGSVGTPEAGIEAEVLRVPSLDALETVDATAVAGKIVFFDGRMERQTDGSGYRAAVAVRGAGASRAAKKGAVAVLIRSVGTGQDRFPHTGGMRYDEKVVKIPAAALAQPDADVLAAQVASGKPVRFRLRSSARVLPDVESANVIGELRGRDKPEEIILLGAHLDSWDLGTGAVDDGAGVAIMTEAARRLGGVTGKDRPRRTVRVVLFANEEFGLSGARAYAETHAAELGRHVLAGESDFGAGRVVALRSAVAPDRLPATAAIAAIAELLAPLGIKLEGNDASGGADTGPLAPGRVPLVDLRQDGTYYFDWHHTANDTVDKIVPQEIDQNVAAWLTVIAVVAEMPGDLGRAPEKKKEE